jgi:hypothetical protein
MLLEYVWPLVVWSPIDMSACAIDLALTR